MGSLLFLGFVIIAAILLCWAVRALANVFVPASPQRDQIVVVLQVLILLIGLTIVAVHFGFMPDDSLKGPLLASLADPTTSNGPIDFTPYLSVGGLAGLLWVITSIVKQMVTVKPTIIPYIVIGLGLVLELLFAFVTNNVTSPNAALGYAAIGILAALSAIGIHEATTDKIKAPT